MSDTRNQSSAADAPIVVCIEASNKASPEFREIVEEVMTISRSCPYKLVNLARDQHKSARQTLGKPYFPSEEDKRRIAAAQERRRRKAISRARSLEKLHADRRFWVLRRWVRRLLSRWHRNPLTRSKLDGKVIEIRELVIETLQRDDVDTWLLRRAANAAICDFLDLDYAGKRHRRQAQLRDAEKSRLKNGYLWYGGEIGRYSQPAFTYHGLRSREHWLLRTFLSMIPRLPDFAASNDKSLCDGQRGDSKLLGQDLAWIETNKKVIGLMRQDLDAVFESWFHLYESIADLNVPLPHLAVGHVAPDGCVHNPHLIWYLPENMGVRTDQNARDKPRLLYRAVMRGLCHALTPIGADPGALSNPCRIKNPLSPHWDVAVMSEADGIPLDRWQQIVDIEARFERLVSTYVQVRAEQDGIPPVLSDQAHHAFRRAGFRTLREWYRRNDARVSQSQDKLRKALLDHLLPEALNALKGGTSPKEAANILRSTLRFVVEVFNPEKATADSARRVRPVRNRGVLREQLRGIASEQKRKALGGAYAAQQRAADTVRLLVDAVVAAGGIKGINKASLARATGVAYRTVMRRWAEVERTIQERNDTKAASTNHQCAIRSVVRGLGAGGDRTGGEVGGSMGRAKPSGHPEASNDNNVVDPTISDGLPDASGLGLEEDSARTKADSLARVA